jgi:acetyltransferase
MAKRPIPKGPNLVVITNGGGPGVMAVDSLSTQNLEPVSLNPETIKKLDDSLPHFWCKGKPIDILGDTSAQRWLDVLEGCLDAHEIDALIIIYELY